MLRGNENRQLRQEVDNGTKEHMVNREAIFLMCNSESQYTIHCLMNVQGHTYDSQ